MKKEERFSLFNDHPELIATISKRDDGNCYFAPTGDAATDAATPVNRATFLTALNIPGDHVVSAGLVHGAESYRATTADGGNIVQNVDALFSRDEKLFLSITVADCIPLFLFDPETQTFGLVHAGWRGVAANIIPDTLRAMAKECDVRPETLLIEVGPSIGACHFEVKDDVAKQFAQFPEAIIRHGDQNGGEKIFVDLKAVARAQLITLGVKSDNLEIRDECTYDLKDRYFSWRRDKPIHKETMMAVIGLR